MEMTVKDAMDFRIVAEDTVARFFDCMEFVTGAESQALANDKKWMLYDALKRSFDKTGESDIAPTIDSPFMLLLMGFYYGIDYTVRVTEK